MAYPLFTRNSVISDEGKVGGVLVAPPKKRLRAMQANLWSLISEADRRGVFLRVGARSIPDVDGEVLVFALDLGGARDTHHFVKRLADVLEHRGARPLDQSLDFERILELVNDLVTARLDRP